MCLSIGMGGSTGGGAGGFGGLPLGLAPALATPGERLVLPSGAYSRLSCLAIGDFHAVACVEHGPGGGLATLDSLPPPSAAPVGMLQHQQRSPPTVPPPRDPPFDYPRTPYDGTTMMSTTMKMTTKTSTAELKKVGQSCTVTLHVGVGVQCRVFCLFNRRFQLQNIAARLC